LLACSDPLDSLHPLSRSEFDPVPFLTDEDSTPWRAYPSVFSIGQTEESVSGSTLYVDGNFTPETNRFPPSRYRRGLSAAFTIPIRGVATIPRAEYPSSPIQRLPAAAVRSTPLSRTRVIPKASHSLPGPLVNFRHSFSPCSSRPRACAISLIPVSGSRARNKTHPAR